MFGDRGFVADKTRAGKHETTLNQKKQDTNIKNFKDNTWKINANKYIIFINAIYKNSKFLKR